MADSQRVAPDRVISAIDPDARHVHKSVSEYRDGFKAHIAIEPDTGLITAAATRPANVGDAPTGVRCSMMKNPACRCSPILRTAAARSR